MKRLLAWAFLLLSYAALPVFVESQQPPQRDASAIAFLTQAVSASGGSTNLAAVRDFTASGTLTLRWGRKTEQAPVTVKSRGLMQFRLDAGISEGKWSYIANKGSGQAVIPRHPAMLISAHNTVNSGALTWPILRANAALLDPSTTITDIGLVQFGNSQVHQIRTQQNFEFDKTGLLSKSTRTDYFFDPSTLALVAIRDVRHPDRDAVNNPLPHTVIYGDYQNVNGMMVPFSVADQLSGQTIWQLHLASIEFNTGLIDDDFRF